MEIGDKVYTGVYVGRKYIKMSPGIIVDQSSDGSVSDVDIMSLHGGAPWIIKERTDHLCLFED